MQPTSPVIERKFGGILEMVKTIVYAVAIAIVIRALAFEPFNIPSGSMMPTLLVGDYLFVSKFSYGYSRFSFPLTLPFTGRLFGSLPERGDVVVFKLPTDDRTDYIKRVVGLPGDKIQVLDGVLQINGTPVKLEPVSDVELGDAAISQPGTIFRETLPGGRQHLIQDLSPTGALDNTRVYEVPPDHLFCMGDNRDNSQDSRVNLVGFVPVDNLVGKAQVIFMSIDGDGSLIRPWTWPLDFRLDRIIKVIN